MHLRVSRIRLIGFAPNIICAMEKERVNLLSYLSHGWYRRNEDKCLDISNFGRWKDPATLSELSIEVLGQESCRKE